MQRYLNRFDRRQMLLEDFGDKALETIRQVLMRSYPFAYDSCYNNYPRAQATELLPAMRRAEIHSKLRQELEPFLDIEVKSEKHKLNNTHSLMIQTDRILLSIAKVDTPEEMVTPTTYDVQYAQDSQLDLFQFDEEPDETLRKLLYGVLLHGFFPTRPKHLGFLRIAFPDSHFMTYIGDTIDLMQRFPEHTVIASPEPIDQEIIAKPAVPRLKNSKQGATA